MKKLLLFLIAATTLLGATTAAPIPQKNRTHEKPAKEYVYVCVSPTAYAYHSDKDCGGLNRCTHEVRKETVSEAKQDGRRACKLCY